MIDWLRPHLADPQVEVAGLRLPVAIRRHARARRLTMRLAPDGREVCITMPTWCGTSDALAFAEARRDWLAGQLARVVPAQAVEPGTSLPYRGVAHRIDWRADAPRRPVAEAGRIVLGGPQAGMVARLQRWLEAEALALCSLDLDHYCARAGVMVPALRLSRARRRWGSCSPPAHLTGPRAAGRMATIRINWRLVMAPDAVRRSVVAHEVAHLSHFDHSPMFHAHLAHVFDGDLIAADRWLREKGRSLHAVFAPPPA